MKQIIKEALLNIEEQPQTKNEMMLVLSSLTLLNALVKLEDYKHDIHYGQFKYKVTQYINYSLEHPELDLLEELFYDAKSRCVYMRCLGLQFSYHDICVKGVFADFVKSRENREVGFDAIYKQPRALGIFKLAKECVLLNITSVGDVYERFVTLGLDFPSLLERHRNRTTKN